MKKLLNKLIENVQLALMKRYCPDFEEMQVKICGIQYDKDSDDRYQWQNGSWVEVGAIGLEEEWVVETIRIKCSYCWVAPVVKVEVVRGRLKAYRRARWNALIYGWLFIPREEGVAWRMALGKDAWSVRTGIDRHQDTICKCGEDDVDVEG